MIRWVAPIVEGDGDVASVRILVQLLCPDLHVARPVRFPKSKLLSPKGLEEAAVIAASNARRDEPGMILLLLDSDRDCPATLGPNLLGRLKAVLPGHNCFVALAQRGFESWIVAGNPGSTINDPDAAGDMKNLASDLNGGRYRKSVDQPKLTARIDPHLLRTRSPSFARFATRLLSAAAALDAPAHDGTIHP